MLTIQNYVFIINDKSCLINFSIFSYIAILWVQYNIIEIQYSLMLAIPSNGLDQS